MAVKTEAAGRGVGVLGCRGSRRSLPSPQEPITPSGVSEPHVSQHKCFELVDICRLELAMDRSQSSDDIDLDLFRLGDPAAVVRFGFLDGVFDNRRIGL